MPTPNIQQILERRREFLRFVERRVADPAIAEDLLQSAYLRAVEHAAEVREGESVVAWFYRILRNAVIDHYRRRSVQNAVLEQWAGDLQADIPAAHEPSALAAHDPATRQFVCGCIASVLPSLNPGYAELLREVELDDVPLTTFAERHGITPGNAAVKAHRARAALKKALIQTCGACSTHACLDCTCPRPVAVTA